MANAERHATDEALAKVKRLDWTGTALLLTAVVALCAVTGSGWQWRYFSWGLGAGVLAVLLVRVTLRISYRWSHATKGDIAHARASSFSRWRSIYVTTVIIGGAIGAFAARIGSAVPDIAFTTFVIGAQIVGLVAARRLLRVSE